jgi:hypothetical protein
MQVEIEADLSGEFTVTTTIRVNGHAYSASAMCDWDDPEKKTEGTCTIEEDGGQYGVVADWGGSPALGMAFKRFFLQLYPDGFRVGEGPETREGVGAEYSMSGDRDVTVEVKLRNVP